MLIIVYISHIHPMPKKGVFFYACMSPISSSKHQVLHEKRYISKMIKYYVGNTSPYPASYKSQQSISFKHILIDNAGSHPVGIISMHIKSEVTTHVFT